MTVYFDSMTAGLIPCRILSAWSDIYTRSTYVRIQLKRSRMKGEVFDTSLLFVHPASHIRHRKYHTLLLRSSNEEKLSAGLKQRFY